MNEILDQSLSSAARKIRTKAISPVELTTASPRQLVANNRLAMPASRVGRDPTTVVVSVVFCLGAETALIERIAIWPPLAATAFGV